MKTKYIIMICFFLLGTEIKAQQVVDLDDFQELFDKGKLKELVATENSLESSKSSLFGGLTKDEKAMAWGLLTIAYIYLRDYESAKRTMRLLLKANRKYEPGKLDPPEFITLLREIKE